MVRIIAAIGQNGEYGYNNALPWPQSIASKADMTEFKKYTTGQTIIMGYNTHMSIGKLLPNRLNIVVSRHPIEGVYTCNSLKDAINLYPDGIVIGGCSLIYELLDQYRHHITEIHLNMFYETFPNANLFLNPDSFAEFSLITTNGPYFKTLKFINKDRN